ncbi:hypothetical protein [Methylomonas koyamae]|uniref:hypothetical protein n=1 Tax=Methylomonas koyamae TaxID=702114 RepID=UPI0016425D0D|nr:hypothetical protein [Methylomonas koyamae]
MKNQLFKLMLKNALVWLFGWCIWGLAYHEVATECKILGRFYVGSQVFECHPK